MLMLYNCVVVVLLLMVKIECLKVVLWLMNINSVNNIIMISVDIGILRNCLFSQFSILFLLIGIGSVFVINSFILCRVFYSFSVVMKFGILNMLCSILVSVFISVFNSNISRYVIVSGILNCSKNVRYIEIKVIIGLMLILILLEIIISVIVQVVILMVVVLCSMFIWLFNEIKLGVFREKIR